MIKEAERERLKVRLEEIEGRRKRVACEKEKVSGRDRDKETVGMRDTGFVMAGNVSLFFLKYTRCPPTLTLLL